MNAPEFTDQALIDQYFKLDAKLDELNAAHRKSAEPYSKAMTAIKGMLHQRLNERGAKHTSVDGGTCFKTLSLQVKCTDKAAYLRFCFGDPDWGANLLTAQVSKDALATFMEKHNEQCPPGVEATYNETVVIRRT